jgi:hypothetical protein
LRRDTHFDNDGHRPRERHPLLSRTRIGRGSRDTSKDQLW